MIGEVVEVHRVLEEHLSAMVGLEKARDGGALGSG
jgi:hypothetical protein